MLDGNRLQHSRRDAELTAAPVRPRWRGAFFGRSSAPWWPAREQPQQPPTRDIDGDLDPSLVPLALVPLAKGPYEGTLW